MEGNNIALFCNKSGKPDPVITWTRIGSSEVLSNASLLTVKNVRRPGTPDYVIQYQCKASNGVENPAIAVANVTVYCKSVVLDRFNSAFNVLWDVVKQFTFSGHSPQKFKHIDEGSRSVNSLPRNDQHTANKSPIIRSLGQTACPQR